MHMLFMIALAFIAWTVLSVPAGLLMGRLLKRASRIQFGS
jgi:hypothetical protein